MEATPTHIYCDASFSKTHRVAVAGYLVVENDDHIVSDDIGRIKTVVFKENNNIRAELRGVIIVIESLVEKLPSNKTATDKSRSIILYTDCQTVANLPQRRRRLESDNFLVKRTQEPLRNADLYKAFYRTYDLLSPTIRWVKGHSSKNHRTQFNERMAWVDKAVRKQLRAYCRDLVTNSTDNPA